MHVTFEKSSTLDPELQELAVQRARRSMQGFALTITQAHLHLSKSLNLLLSSEKRCWVQITVAHSVVAIGVAKAADWRGAIDKAFARAIRGVPSIQRKLRENARMAIARTRKHKGRRERALESLHFPTFSH